MSAKPIRPMAIEVPRLEDKTIQPIPLNERHGKARDLFTIWFGSNIMILTIVTGGLATTIFGLDIVTATLGLVIGNVVGGVFMALHSAQGPQLGVAQMVQTRGQFGSYGALLVVVLVVIMQVGYFSANLVFGGQAMATVVPGLGADTGVILIGIASVVAAIFGYRLIHAYTKAISVVAGLALLISFFWILFVNEFPANFFEQGSFNWVGIMGTASVAAFWQLSYAPYVSDYSRYLPRGTGSRPAFWASYSGSVLGAFLPMLLGAIIGTLALAAGGEANGVDIVESLGSLIQPWTALIIGIFCISLAAANAINLYCSVLSSLTVGQTFKPSWLPRARTRSVVAVTIFLLALTMALMPSDNFLVVYQNFLALLLYVMVPWTAINLVDYYLLRHGNYKVDDFFRSDGGIYGRFNWVAIGSYAGGALIQLPFSSTAIYTGPVAAALGGVDISWIIGLLVVSPGYYLVARITKKNTSPQPDQPRSLATDLT